MFEPLDVRLGITVHLAVELYVAAHRHCLVGREASLQDGPVGGAFCRGAGTKFVGRLVYRERISGAGRGVR